MKTPPPPAFEKLERDPLHERVYRQLRDAIISAQFEPGQKLTVRMISASFGISTMPIRAALARLVAERAVTALATGTVAIPRLTRDSFLELVELRVLLEGTAIAKACGRLTPDDLDAIVAAGEDLTAAAHEADAERYIRANRSFKFMIFEGAHSPALVDLIERVWLQVAPFMRYYGYDVRRQIETDEHDAMVEALRRNDPEAARAALERDIRGGAQFILDTVEF